MTRVVICAIFALAYLVWVAIYLLPYSGNDVLPDANLRRVFRAATFY